MQIATDVLTALGQARTEDNRLFLSAQLDRALYLKTNKVLDAAGGKWNRKEKAHIFPSDAGERIDQLLMTGEITIPRDEFNYFPTPPDIIAAMIAGAAPVSGDRILEPSFGDGRIIRALKTAAPDARITGIELMSERFELANTDAKLHASATLINADFLSWQPEHKFDVILMNPPFFKRSDVKHVNHALDMLVTGGRFASVMPSSIKFREDSMTVALRKRIIALGGSITDLPADTFKSVGTRVNTVMVKI
ncbi:class I SAM-dependent methyltransferase [Enterobacter hormaechei]